MNAWYSRTGRSMLALALAATVIVCTTAVALADHSRDSPARPKRDPAHKRIEINLSLQQLIAWDGDEAVFEFPVTTGQEDQPTITGEFEILDKEAEAYSEPWMLNMPFWMGIYQLGDYEDGIHALPTDGDGVEYWRDAVGHYPASHGCVVLRPEDAEALFQWAAVGIPVEIHD